MVSLLEPRVATKSIIESFVPAKLLILVSMPNVVGIIEAVIRVTKSVVSIFALLTKTIILVSPAVIGITKSIIIRPRSVVAKPFIS